MTIITIAHHGDLFEIRLKGFVIARISCYFGGTHRQDMQFDDCPTEIQERILDAVEKQVSKEK